MKEIPLCLFDNWTGQENPGIDVVTTESFRDYLHEKPVYRTDYFSIYFITEGRELLQVNDVSEEVELGTVITSRPGELWTWQPQTQLEGPYLFFMEHFIQSVFHDRQFVSSFSFFNSNRPTSFHHPSKQVFLLMLDIIGKMQQEAHADVPDHHFLRAMLYELMALLEREVCQQPHKPIQPERLPTRGDDYYIKQFQELASAYFVSEHQVEFYADRLCITSNYLNKIVRHSLGVSTKQYLSQQLLAEAIRMLRYTTLSVNEVAESLRLEPAYFIKWFRQNKGFTPLQFKKNKVSR